MKRRTVVGAIASAALALLKEGRHLQWRPNGELNGAYDLRFGR